MSTKDVEGAALTLSAAEKTGVIEKLTVLPWLLAAASGALGALSMPSLGLGFLVWFALIPLFFALRGRKPRCAFQISFVAGVVFFAILLYWLYTLGDWAGPLIIVGYLLLVGYLALYWGAFGTLYSWLSKRLPDSAMIVIVPAIWIALEFLRALGPFGFTWGVLAQAVYQEISIIQIASLAGIWGISCLIILINYLLYLGISRCRWQYPVLALIVVGMAFGWGLMRASQPLVDKQALKVALVQPNIPQAIKGDVSYLAEFLAKYQGLLDQISPRSADLVILPESILPAYVLRDNLLREYFEGWAHEHESTVILGTLDARPSGYFNSAALISPSGALSGTYDKVHLVPFSTEYFPGKGLMDRLGLWRWVPIGRLGFLSPGEGFQPLSAPWGRVGVSICFESIFSDIGRALVQQDAELLVTVTNDAWFKESWELPQHLALGVFRAVETDRYFIQAANTGLSAIVDPHGRILSRAPIAQATLLQGTAGVRDGQTMYSRYGDWFIYLALGLLGLSLLLGILRHQSRLPLA
jgi:apolipoprotein N-acyltransferase